MERHRVGWIVVWNQESHSMESRPPVRSGLSSFIGDYGEKDMVVAQGEVTLGIKTPIDYLPLTTWSLYEGGSSFCFVTGTFYGAYNGYSPKDGVDHDLAKMIFNTYRTCGEKTIAHLNGSFSGVIWDAEKQILVSFVDRLGVQVVYRTQIGNMLVLSTNLAALRPYRRFEFDEVSVFQYLICGFPLLERTLFRHIFLQEPCTSVLFFRDDKQEKRRYYTMPGRGGHRSLADGAIYLHETWQGALCRIAERMRSPLFLALSGGHDSRLILSALHSAETPFEVVHWQTEDFNSRVAQKLCRIIGKPLHCVSIPEDEESRDCHEAGFIYSDGSHSTHWGFFSLGRTAWLNGGTNLLTGFAADVLSGGLSIPDPARVNSFQKLCTAVWDSSCAEFFTFAATKNVFPDFSEEVEQTIRDEWRQTFWNVADLGDNFTDQAIWQRLTTRNFRRVRFAMIPIVKHVQWIPPALDNDVFDAYMSLPLHLVYLQRAHCLGAYIKNPAFGRLPACGFPIPLQVEALAPQILYSFRMVHKYSKKLLPTWLRRPKTLDDRIPVSLLAESLPLRIRKNALERTLRKTATGRRCYHQILTLKRVCDAYINGCFHLS